MKTEIIKGHTIEYNFFDSEDREIDETDTEHIGSLLVEGFTQGELNQYDHETDTEVSGWWNKVD